MAEQTSSIEDAVRMSHRHLMGALLIISMLGLAALLSLGSAGRGDKILWTVLPGLIGATAASLHRMYKRVDTRAMKAMRSDELRQAGLSRAWRNGFFAVLALQPLLALGFTWSGATYGVALMAAATAFVGAGAALATLQWYDR